MPLDRDTFTLVVFRARHFLVLTDELHENEILDPMEALKWKNILIPRKFLATAVRSRASTALSGLKDRTGSRHGLRQCTIYTGKFLSGTRTSLDLHRRSELLIVG